MRGNVPAGKYFHRVLFPQEVRAETLEILQDQDCIKCAKVLLECYLLAMTPETEKGESCALHAHSTHLNPAAEFSSGGLEPVTPPSRRHSPTTSDYGRYPNQLDFFDRFGWPEERETLPEPLGVPEGGGRLPEPLAAPAGANEDVSSIIFERQSSLT